MLGVSELDGAQPKKWRDAADDALVASRNCAELAPTARDEVASTLNQCWVDETGRAARRKFVKQADEFDAAAESLRGLAKVYDTLADAVESAQRDLHSALDYARANDLNVDESGRVQSNTPTVSEPGAVDPRIAHVKPIIDDALRKATEADTEAASTLRTIHGLAEIEDPALVRQALADGADGPLAVALRMKAGRGDLHPINVGPEQLAAVDRAARETGMSKTLLLAILWQEQQWYQNHDPDLQGPLPFTGRVFNWSLQETVKPDKSLGITHVKLKTARDVMARNRDAFTVDGQFLGDLNDSQLAKYIEENPNDNIRLSAYYLQDLQENSYGAGSDKQLFMLYAADSGQVRESNAEYGDSTEERGGAIKHRAENWDELQAPLWEAQGWDALSQEEQLKALEQIESQTPAGHSIDLNPVYGAGISTGTGTGAPEPGTPSPSPGPPPTPPGA